MNFKIGDLVTVRPEVGHHYIKEVRFESSFIARIKKVELTYVTVETIQCINNNFIGDEVTFSKDYMFTLNEAIKRGFKI